jgi:hypothetical protein
LTQPDRGRSNPRQDQRRGEHTFGIRGFGDISRIELAGRAEVLADVS